MSEQNKKTLEDWKVHRQTRSAESLSTVAEDDMLTELERRMLNNTFPLEVFSSKIKPLLHHMENELNLPSSYIGVTLLMAYSVAVGNSYMVDMGTMGKQPLGIWAATVGISSQGKSVCASQLHFPLREIQTEYDQFWTEKTAQLSKEAREREKMETIMYRDIHVATLTRYVLPDNPKGLMKDADELIEWINGLNSLSKKEGIDEQFWITAWDGKDYPLVRSGKDKIVLPRLFVNVFGGIQPAILERIFKNDRDTTGFSFRMLFAVPEAYKVARPNFRFIMPEALRDIHRQSIFRLYKELPVHDPYDYHTLVMTPESLERFDQWRNEKLDKIDMIRDTKEKNIHSGIMGKINSYAMRFSALLHLGDKSYTGKSFEPQEIIELPTLERALKLADYFFDAAVEVYAQVTDSIFATPEAQRFKEYFDRRTSLAEIAQAEYPTLYKRNASSARSKANRRKDSIKKEYPNYFGIREK